jgi:DNA polymerase III subunit epsilon
MSLSPPRRGRPPRGGRPATPAPTEPILDIVPDGPFVALDFETSHAKRDSACAVALVRVEGDRVVARVHRLIQPPKRAFMFTRIHGIRWQDVADEPPFAEVWPELTHLIEGVAFIAAHNASFDRSVLRACLERAALPMPRPPFLCTVRVARRTWRLKRANLPACCDFLGIELDHHQALSDAEACARIVIAARRA